MFSRVRLRPRGGRLGQCHPASRPSFKRFTHNDSPGLSKMDWSPYPVRILGPTLWSVTAIGTIYFTCAAYDVYQDAKKYSKGDRRTLTFEQIEADAAPKRFRDKFLSTPSDARTGPIVVSSPLDLWNGLSGPGKVMASVIGINTLTLGLRYVPSKLTRRFVYSLAHTPVQGNFRYRQLLTSAFAHTGPIHMGMNMLVMFNFASSLARTPEFEGSGSHTLAFYLSGGIVSSLGNHIATRFWPNKMARLMPALGFSGVVSAIFAAWCMEHPDGRVRLLFIPWDFTARGMLEGVTAFEVVGVLGLLRYTPIHVAHAAHLSGLLFGAAYVTYGQGGKYWNSFRSAAFRGLKTVGAI